VAPAVEDKPVRCAAFHSNKPCKEERKISYLSSDCGISCPSWDGPEDICKEEYKRELLDNYLYYSNKDISQEDIFFEKDDLQFKKPQFVLPSYQGLTPSKPPKLSSPKAKSDPGDLVERDESLFSTSSSPEPSLPESNNEPSSPISTAGSSEIEVNPNAVFSSHLETWKTRQPMGHGRTMKHENPEGNE
jgi:hypothetical protein